MSISIFHFCWSDLWDHDYDRCLERLASARADAEASGDEAALAGACAALLRDRDRAVLIEPCGLLGSYIPNMPAKNAAATAPLSPSAFCFALIAAAIAPNKIVKKSGYKNLNKQLKDINKLNNKIKNLVKYW